MVSGEDHVRPPSDDVRRTVSIAKVVVSWDTYVITTSPSVGEAAIRAEWRSAGSVMEVICVTEPQAAPSTVPRAWRMAD